MPPSRRRCARLPRHGGGSIATSAWLTRAGQQGLGNEVVALGQLSRAVVEEAHARHCAAGRWVLNEKRIQEGTGLPVRLPSGAPSQVVQTVARQLAEPDR